MHGRKKTLAALGDGRSAPSLAAQDPPSSTDVIQHVCISRIEFIVLISTHTRAKRKCVSVVDLHMTAERDLAEVCVAVWLQTINLRWSC